MMLLRLIGDILIYIAIGLFVYYYLSEDMMALFIAIGCGLVGGLILMYTPSRHRRSDRHYKDTWDWWHIVELIEIPITLIGWLFRGIIGIFRIFN